MKVAQLIYNEETECYYFDGRAVHCGDCFEVLIYNGLTEKIEWTETRMENGQDWYLVGLLGYQINGLFARTD